MELKGKKIAFLGDSITAGVGPSTLDNVYWKVLERNTGALCFGFGVGGSRMAVNRVPSPNPAFDQNFVSRADDLIDDADVVVVFGGVNDFAHGDAPFGCHDDRTEETFCGAVHVLMEKLLARYPYGQTVFMTPLHCEFEDEVGMNPYGVRRCANLETYVNAIMEAAAFYGIPVLDLFRTSSIQPRVPFNKQLNMPDGIHPNDAGNLRIAGRLEGFLRSL